MDKYIKLIQTRLNRRLKVRGQSVTKQQVRDIYSQVVKIVDKPTDLEIDRVTQLLVQKVSEETIQNGHLIVASSGAPESVTIEITPESNPDIWETLQPPAIEPEQEKPEQEKPEQEKPEQETANTDSIVPATNHLPIQQQPANTPALISQSEITAAIAQAIQQTGQQGNDEAIQILTSLANELSADIADTQEMVVALVSTYLGKRQTILSSAIGTLNTLRSAQTQSFQGGLNQDFFGQKQKNKHEFLNKVSAMFN